MKFYQIALTMALQAFSDVPAAAWWMMALALALRPRPLTAVAAGLAVGMAILTRPNLAPLALVPAAFVLASSRSGRLFRSGVFASAAVGGGRPDVDAARALRIGAVFRTPRH